MGVTDLDFYFVIKQIVTFKAAIGIKKQLKTEQCITVSILNHCIKPSHDLSLVHNRKQTL